MKVRIIPKVQIPITTMIELNAFYVLGLSVIISPGIVLLLMKFGYYTY